MVRSGAQMRTYLVDEVNNMLRRTGMYGGEPALWTTFHHLFFLEDDDNGMEDMRQSWRERNAFTPLGIKGALAQHLPGNILTESLASMYAEVARNRGWLRLDRTLTGEEYAALRREIASFAAQDRTLTEVVTAFGEPSFRAGGTSPYYGKALCYATADIDDPMVTFHLWNGTDPEAEQDWPPKYAEPVLLAIRCGTGSFPASFSFTPEGERRRPPDEWWM